MTSTATAHHSFECDYLRSLTSSAYVFASEHAELLHVNEQIRSLDGHISQLNTLRRALHYRSRQLHNILSPVNTLPLEVLSRIFQQIVDSKLYHNSKFTKYSVCLGRALVLSSVSAHFRHVALCTPELWKRVPLGISSRKKIGKLSSLLQHCTALVHRVNVSINDELVEEDVYPTFEILFTPNVARKIKAVELDSSGALSVWIANFKSSSFPILDTLDIFCGVTSLDLQTFNTITRLRMRNFFLAGQTIMPPSVRYLHIDVTRLQDLFSILCQCPYIEECFANDEYLPFNGFNVGTQIAQLNKPLTLTHLKRLTLGRMKITTTTSQIQNIQLPSLEYLRLNDYQPSSFPERFILCHGVAATLTILKISAIPGTFEYDDLYKLCGLPFPRLRKLGFYFWFSEENMPNIIHALTERAEECKPYYFPSLSALTLGDCTLEPRCLLGLLDKWRIGEGSYFHVKAKVLSMRREDWSPELREELYSIVGSRQIEVTWNGDKVLRLLGRTDGSLQNAVVD